MDTPGEIKGTPPGRDLCVFMLGYKDHRKLPMRAPSGVFQGFSTHSATEKTAEEDDDSLSSRLLPS